MIEKIKQDLKQYKGKRIKFKYKGSRNQVEVFEGKITKCYKSLFLIEGDNFSKTFTYSDILTKILEINIK